MEKKLQEEEESFFRVFYASSNPMVITTPETGTVVDINEACATFLDRRRDEIIGRTALELGVWKKSQDREQALNGLGDAKKTRSVAVDIRSGAGEAYTILLHVETIMLCGEQYLLTTGTDITERERHAEALRRSEEKYRALVENSLQGVCIIQDDRLVFCNGAFAAVTGHSVQELLAIGDIIPMVHPDDRDLIHKLPIDGDPGTLEKVRYQHRIIKKDGSLAWVEVHGSRMEFNGRPAVQVTSVDITELKESQEYLNRVINSMGDSIVVKDRRHRYIIANDAFCRQLGRSREEFLGKQVRDLVPGELGERLWELDEQVMSTGRETLIEQDVIDEKGVPRTLLSKRSVLLDKNGEVQLISSIRDITEHKRLHAQFQQAQKMEAIGVLAGGIAHDFNNLLNVINGYTELMLDDLDPENPLRKDLQQVRDAGQRAASLTAQLLAFSRKQMIQPELLNLAEVIEDMSKMLSRLMGEDVAVTTVGEPGLWLINADPGQIHQIVMNLAANARDAMPEGGRFTLQAENVSFSGDYVSAHPVTGMGEYVMLTVSDNGIGMDAAAQSHLFEPFFTTKEKGKGTGLGLSTVYGIVKQNKGYIWVYSEPGKGTTFKLYFPRAASEEGSALTMEQSKPEPAPAAHATVLVVEDEASLRTLTCRILRNQGYEVLEAADGLDALRVVQECGRSIDLVLTDAVMPGMGGKELVGRLRNMLPGIKVLYMSGYTDHAIVENGILDPGIEFIQKPFKVDGLTTRVRQVLSPRGEDLSGADRR